MFRDWKLYKVAGEASRAPELTEFACLVKDMFRDWELYKVAVEASRAPEMMLIVDKWEQLQFVSREFFSKYDQINQIMIM